MREPFLSAIVNAMKREKTIGLALGGGGARGLVHILVLEVLEEFGLRPTAVSGTSIGAVLGALYCSGHGAQELREFVERHIKISGDKHNWKEDGLKMMEMVKLLDLNFAGTGLIKGDRISHFLYEMLNREVFEDLDPPLSVVATDLWESSQVVFSEGPVLPAVKASMSVPGVFAPVVHDNRVLVDGACVNPVPWELLSDCDVVIGVNALGRSKAPDSSKPPKAAKVVLESFEIVQRGIFAEKKRSSPPDYLVDPPIRDVGLLEFHKAANIYEQSEEAVAGLRVFLEKKFRRSRRKKEA